MRDRIKHIGKPVLTPETTDWGGKGANLLELAQFENVPKGFVVNAEAYDRFTNQQEIQNLEWINEGNVDLDWIEENPETELEEIQNTTQEVFLNNNLPAEYREDITSAIHQYEGEMFARSSAVNEDGEENSGAGRLESFGPMSRGEILEGTKKVFASAFDEKAIKYLTENNIDSFGGVAVVVQEAVDPAFGGVMYSSDPNGNPDKVYIEANETPWQVVDDDIRDIIHVDADEIPSGRSGEGNFQYKNNKGNSEPLPDAEQVMEISGAGKDIEDVYNSPMDIEFAYNQEGELYILQGRPITVEGYGEPDFNIPDDIRDIDNEEVLAETSIVRNAGILEELPAVVIDDANSSGMYQTEGSLEEYNNQFSEGYVVVTPVMNENIENRTDNAAGLVASEGGKTSHASTVADESGMLYMGALESEPQEYLEHGDNVYMAVNGHEGVFARGEEF
ncbi:MAG: pyruvate,water dikinase [Colwellia polaris]|jgi:pyruvate,water dikinase